MSNLDSDPGAMVFQIILIIVLTAINAFFASAEMAIVSVNKQKVKKLSDEGNKKAILLKKLIEEPSNFLSTIQIGITLAGFFSSASAATGISKYLANLIEPLSVPYCEEISMIVVTLILSYITLVFGELVPKRIAMKKSEKIALFSVNTIYFISKIAKPFIKLLSFSTMLVLKLTNNSQEENESKVSEEEIRELILQSQIDGCIEKDEKQMIYGVFEFNDTCIKEIMTPRSDMFAIDINDSISENLEDILNSGYSRIPVYEDTIDNIVGILYIKDILLEAKKVGFENIDIKNILNEPYFVVENKRSNELFKELKEKKVHLSLLFDEYGGITGLVTMEDLIEAIVGDIEDEYDNEESSISKIDDKTFKVKGSLSVSEFNNRFDIHLEEGDYDTINGYLLTKLGNIPNEKEVIELENITFKIEKVKNRRIEDIKIILKQINEQII
ncbi:MAG: HlyC/CorC family transporter [Peptostreptococcaceae bacterium]|nr:HlyC/CorC family transporter [Peptostreptococcaceae bacterium]